MAKLIDILARELNEWPHGQKYAEQSRVDNEVYFQPHDLGDFYVSERAEDYDNTIVTRAEWQAAVGALNKPDVVEWDGEGLPPVGSIVNIRFPEFSTSSPHAIKIIFIGKRKIFYTDQSTGEEYAHLISEVELSQVRTPEQVAAEERKEFIDEINSLFIAAKGYDVRTIGEVIYGAGYRKQGQK